MCANSSSGPKKAVWQNCHQPRRAVTRRSWPPLTSQTGCGASQLFTISISASPFGFGGLDPLIFVGSCSGNKCGGYSVCSCAKRDSCDRHTRQMTLPCVESVCRSRCVQSSAMWSHSGEGQLNRSSSSVCSIYASVNAPAWRGNAPAPRPRTRPRASCRHT